MTFFARPKLKRYLDGTIMVDQGKHSEVHLFHYNSGVFQRLDVILFSVSQGTSRLGGMNW